MGERKEFLRDRLGEGGMGARPGHRRANVEVCA